MHSINWKRSTAAVLCAWSLLALIHAAPSEAKLFEFRLPEAAGSQPAGYEIVEPLPHPGQAVCCPDYCISYRQHLRLKKICCGCPEPQEIVLDVLDPLRCGCRVQVPLCIPGCCEGAPCVAEVCGLFGRGYVTYEWSCGYKIKVAFLLHEPTVIVHQYGE